MSLPTPALPCVAGLLAACGPPRPGDTADIEDTGPPGCIHIGGTNYATLEEAAAAAVSGDVIELCAGTFPPVTFYDAGDITLQGAGMDATVLDGALSGPEGAMVLFVGEMHLTLRDLTVTGGYTGEYVDDCGERVGTGGAGMYLSRSTVVAERVAVRGNVATEGGVITLLNSNLSMFDGVIAGNISAGPRGAAVQLLGWSYDDATGSFVSASTDWGTADEATRPPTSSCRVGTPRSRVPTMSRGR